MKIFDFHLHAGNFAHLREDIQELLTRKPFDDGYGIDEVFSDPRKLVEYLDGIGVVGGMVLAECGPGTNFSIDSELIAEFCSSEEKLIPFGSINPNYHDCIEEFEKSVAMGVRGFKLYPADHVFDPLTDEMMEVYRRCEEKGMPIVFHTGLTAQKNTEQNHIKPYEFEVLAKKFPKLVIIMAHTGNPHWHTDALDLAARYENVYVDTGLVPVKNWSKIYDVDEGVKQKILFGSDFPVCGSYSVLVEEVKNANLDPKLKEMILYGNGIKLIKKIEENQGMALFD